MSTILASQYVFINEQNTQGSILVLGGIDQFPESRSRVFMEEAPGDFSAGGTGVMLAVRVEMEGRVWEVGTVGV